MRKMQIITTIFLECTLTAALKRYPSPPPIQSTRYQAVPRYRKWGLLLTDKFDSVTRQVVTKLIHLNTLGFLHFGTFWYGILSCKNIGTCYLYYLNLQILDCCIKINANYSQSGNSVQ